MRIGSLCSGAGQLDRAVEQVLGAETVWHCEINDAASKVLAHRWPAIPNHRDLTTTDWDTVEPVDILTGGYPCQPFSHAGQRKGADDERHIWPDVREAIRRLRPRLTVLENVAGHRSLGFDRVLGDLAEDGMYVRWTSLRASDVGAAHARERLWIIVTPNTEGDGWPRINGRPSSGAACGGRERQPAGSARRASVPDPSGVGRGEGWTESEGLFGGLDASLSGAADLDLFPTPKASDGDWGTPRTSGRPIEKSTHLGTIVSLLPTPKASDASGGKHNSEGHADSLPGTVRLLPTPRATRGGSSTETVALLPTPRRSDGDGGPNPLSREERMDDVETRVIRLGGEWGEYEPAVRRWESLTRRAPAPTEPNTKGNPRLNPAFSEWLMGWGPGWVTDVPGISRNDKLRIIGNGVVPQCAAAALTQLLLMEAVA